MNTKRTTQICALLIACFSMICGCSAEKNKRSADEKKAAKWAEKTLAGLSLEKKVAQMICTDITGAELPDDDPRPETWLKLAGEYGVGGFVLYKGTPGNVARLLNRLQMEAEIPLLISADFEGGAGQQVTGASEFPANMGFAAAGDTDLMYRAARVMASEGRAMGIRLSYTPVCDLTVSPDNPQESVRSLGGDIDLMKMMVGAYIKAYHDEGMLTTAKHFPGRGDMKPYPAHPGFNYLDKTETELMNNEFRAFKNAIDEGVDFIMTEHIAVPSATGGSELPASVEPALVTGIIKDRLGFNGIITTDDLWYDHVVQRFGEEEVAVMALEAGHDVLLKPKDPVKAIRAIADAVNSGRISMDRIDRSVYKLLYRKALLGLHKNRYVDETGIEERVGTPENLKIVSEVANKSITLVKNDGVLPLEDVSTLSIVNITIAKTLTQSGIGLLEGKLESELPGISNYVVSPGDDKQDYTGIQKAAASSDLLILSFMVQRERYGDAVPLGETVQLFIEKLVASKPGAVIAVSYGNPYIINVIGDVPVFIVGYGEGGWYGNQAAYFDSFIKILKSELAPAGRLPVRVNDIYTTGYGLSLDQGT